MQARKNNAVGGFTLVELLAVIAIIGILASITYVSLSGARERAKDRSITADMQSILLEAAFYRANTGSYSGFCVDTSESKVGDLLAKISNYAPTTYACEDDAGQFGVIVPLHSGAYYCVDSTRLFGERTGDALVDGLCPGT